MNRSLNWQSVAVAFLTLAIYLLTMYPLTRPFSFHLLIIASVTGIALVLFKRDEHTLMTFSSFSIILLVVGITGWFFSPFFSWLYILSIALAFLLDAWAAYSFVLILTAILLPNVGAIDTRFDLMSLFSLLAIIPITHILRKEYLKLRENEKQILILHEENKKYQSNLEEVLANKVTKMAVDLREPINDSKQLAHYGYSHERTKSAKENYGKIILMADKALQQLKVFEQTVTGKKLLKNPS